MIIQNTNYTAKYDWGDTTVQGGDVGLVLTDKGNYKTAFVEAFPKNPRTFIRGEGKTISEAEDDAWEQYQRVLNCDGHEFERRGYRNGAGFCKKCNIFKSKVFEPSEKCVVCGCNTFFASDTDGNYYCEEHKSEIPEDKQWDIPRRIRERMNNK
ncbi:hypothetical protein ACOMCU_00760 [Lysinibacillus sp. UGB7]|uniref:hypothetical protein n=1 Tax=Lysinibacillus sp. UGB7 TaxID=3411039 RepID=UPI003B787D5C